MSESSKCLAQIAANLQIGRIRRHIFLCADQTEPHCAPRDASIISWNYLKKRLADLGLLAGEHCVYRTNGEMMGNDGILARISGRRLVPPRLA
jgi:hypothetical protein